MAEKKETAKIAEKKEPAMKETKKEVKKVLKEKAVKVDTTKKVNAKANVNDFSVILNPVITEKSMMVNENNHQITFKVNPSANKTQIKHAFERIFNVKAKHVSVVTVRAKDTTRGGRYPGKIQGYKKAIITLMSGEVVDLFKE